MIGTSRAVAGMQFAVLVLCMLIGAAGGCQSASGPANVASGSARSQKMTRTELYFGCAREDGPNVSEWQWRNFVNEEILPRFPAGLTIFAADGQWRGKSGSPIREQSWVVVILHEPSASADEKIEQIREIYKNRFHQEAVMRTDSTESVSF